MISLLGAKSNYIVKVIKLLYNVTEVGNHWFATYHMHHKEKLEMIKSTYNLYLLFRSKPLRIVGMQTNDTLILADNNFASTKKKAITLTKIMTKDREYLISAHLLKFKGTQMKLNSNGIVLIKKSYVERIFLVTNHVANSTNSKKIIKKKLLSKKQYLA